MSSDNQQTNNFVRFLRNNATVLLIIFCTIAIATVLIVATVTNGNVIPADNKVVDDNPVIEPAKPDVVTQTVKQYYSSPLDYTGVTMDYTDGDELFVFNNTLDYWTTHYAVDLSAQDGTQVCAMFDGTVLDVSESYGLGKCVTVDHGNNVVATYASLAEVAVSKGESIKQGDNIGTVGTTASYEFEDGAHLHLEVTANGEHVNPMPYVRGEEYVEITQN